MYQDNEIVNLLLVWVLAPVIGLFAQRARMPGRHLFFWAYAAMACAYTTTVIEGPVLPDLFNLIEHVSLAMAGVLFAVGCHRLMSAARHLEASR